MLPKWTYILPVIAGIAFFLHPYLNSGFWDVLGTLLLIGAVLAAVQHAETVAHQIGEPIGSVVLAVAVTVIEVSLIVALMFYGKGADSALARDTVFAAVMIILNGMVGLCILIGSLKFGEQQFGLQGITSALTILVAISMLTLVLPNYTISMPGPIYNKPQLISVAIVTLVLYAIFLIEQNFRHQRYYQDPNDTAVDDSHVKPGKKAAFLSLVFLLVALASVVLLAESLAPDLEHALASWGAPHSLVGATIAIIVLLPESISAIQAARRNRLQRSLNLALGSALASIGLTIPTIAMFSVLRGSDLILGIDTKETVLLLLSILVILVGLRTGKTTIVQGSVLLIIFFVYLFTLVAP